MRDVLVTVGGTLGPKISFLTKVGWSLCFFPKTFVRFFFSTFELSGARTRHDNVAADKAFNGVCLVQWVVSFNATECMADILQNGSLDKEKKKKNPCHYC